MAEKKKDTAGRILKEGEGQRANGTYRYRYTGSDGVRRAVYAKTLKELREKEKIIQKDLMDGINTAKADQCTVQKFFEQWFEVKNDLRPNTKNNYLIMWNNNVMPSALAGMKMSDVKKIHIQKFYNSLQDSGKAKNTIKLINTMLKQLFQSAVDSDIVRKNPVTGVKFSGTEKIKEALTAQEQEALLQFVRNSSTYNIYYPMISIAIGTALRVGELTGLTWSDIDSEAGYINIDHQLRYIKIDGETRFTVTDTKTTSGNRKIPLTAEVRQAFAEQKRLMMLSGRRSEAEIDGHEGFIFITKTGRPMATNAVNFVLKNIVQAYNRQEEELAAVEDRQAVYIPHVSAHILRHTGCTRMAEAGIQPKTLQYIMGHSKIDITLNVYTHSNDDQVRKEMQKAEKIIGF